MTSNPNHPCYFGFSLANTAYEPAWFHTREAAQRFAQACGWGGVQIETCHNPEPNDVLDTADKPWTAE